MGDAKHGATLPPIHRRIPAEAASVAAWNLTTSRSHAATPSSGSRDSPPSLPAGRAWKTAESDAAGPKAVASGLVTCVLSPEMTEGPYYVAADAKIRKDIRAGRPGTPLALKLGVANVASCKPVKGAAVDIWHADAGGVYSDEQQNDTVGQTLPARRPEDERERHRDVHDDLPRLVSGPHGAHPREGAHRRQRRAHGPALLRRRAHGQGLREDRRTPRVRTATRATRTTRSTSTAAAARCSPSRSRARATPRRSGWAFTSTRRTRPGRSSAARSGPAARARAAPPARRRRSRRARA